MDPALSGFIDKYKCSHCLDKGNDELIYDEEGTLLQDNVLLIFNYTGRSF